MDPVELVGGKEVPGDPGLTVERDGFVYRFASERNRGKFLADPPRYELADGGACGRMGALSGLGDARRYAVHAGRIYVFASEGCRSGFLREPERCIDRPDEPPTGTRTQVEQGRASIDRLMAWAGGRERLGAVRSYQHRIERTVPSGQTTARVVSVVGLEVPGRFLRSECWDDACWAFMASDGGGKVVSGKGEELLAAQRVDALRRTMGRLPLEVIRASRADDFVAVSDGEGEIGGTRVEFVRTWHAGVGVRLGVEKETGRLVSLSFRGREGGGPVTEQRWTFSAYATISGVTLPVAWCVRADGAEGAEVKPVRVEVDTPVRFPGDQE